MKVFLPLTTLVLGAALGYFLKTPERPSAAPSPPILQTLGAVTGRAFPLATVVKETTGHQILRQNESHQELIDHLSRSAQKVSELMSQPESPARLKSRINEVSALFEEALLREISSHPDFTCDFPKTKDGKTQRAGYPDLRVEHLPTKTVAYLDPKLFAAKSITSSFRTFYYEPSPDRTKVTEDALHLLVGFPHDGQARAWTFGEPGLVDLSTLEVTLKAEFSASNRDLYRDP